MNKRLAILAALGLGVLPLAVLTAQDPKSRPTPAAAAWLPAGTDPATASTSELRDIVERWSMDHAALLRRYGTEYSSDRRDALRAFSRAWQTRLETTAFDGLSVDGRIDWLLLRNRLRHELLLLDREDKTEAETAPLLPFAGAILGLQDSRRRLESVKGKEAARTLATIAEQAEKARKALDPPKTEPGKDAARDAAAAKDASKDSARPSKIVAFRASETLESLKETLASWFKYSDRYDPVFSWWCDAPYKKADTALEAYRKVLREKIVGVKEGEDDPIVGDPVGRDFLVADLADEWIVYTPEELISIAEREYAWCEVEAKKAAREMGLGDDWKAALEKVKNMYVEPGKQPDLIRDLAHEAIDWVEKRDLVTVPALAKDIWRMEMMTPERQKIAPFFLGGEVIQVSFPTDTMAEDDKMMSLRGNNIHFSRSTVFHELIPGHHLQGFMTARYNPQRRAFSTPFWGEGWAFYWERLLWELGFPQSPENRIGMLFWRMHRCARVIFSLSVHLGTMTPQQAIDFLVEKVGHERFTATGEVRRSFNGSYPPLYQLAYMMGALQFHQLHRDLVDSGKMTNKEFHDAVLKGGSMPIEMVRAMLMKAPLTRDARASWKFAGDITPRKP